MANITVVVGVDTLRRARTKALEQGTSVNALVRDFLDEYAGPSVAGQAIGEFLELASQTRATSAGMPAWTRDEVNDRAGLR
jgi:hypothetical protein